MSPLRGVRGRVSNSSSTLGRIERLLLNIVIIRGIREPFSMLAYPHMLLRHPLVVLRPSTADLFVIDNVAMPSSSALVHTLSIFRRATTMMLVVFPAMLGGRMLPIFMITMQNAFWPDLVGYDGCNTNSCQQTSGSLEKTIVVMIVAALLTTRRRVRT
jgi:hypothetical protein